MGDEGWFHVEHAPVQKSAPATRALLDESVHLGINDLDRQRGGELGQGAHSFAGQFGANARGGSFNPHADSAARNLRFAENQEAFRSGPNQMVQAPRPERPATPKDINGLEQTRLAGRVRSADERELRVELHRGLMQAAEIRHLHPPKRHSIRASSA